MILVLLQNPKDGGVTALPSQWLHLYDCFQVLPRVTFAARSDLTEGVLVLPPSLSESRLEENNGSAGSKGESRDDLLLGTELPPRAGSVGSTPFEPNE